jgi:hypothetical protein
VYSDVCHVNIYFIRYKLSTRILFLQWKFSTKMSLKDAYFCHRHLLRTCLYTEYFLPWKLCTLNKPNKCIFNNIFCLNRFYQYISICLHVMFKMVVIKGGIVSVHLCLLSLFLNTCMMYTETVCIYLFHKKLEFTNHMGTTYPLHWRYTKKM